MFMIMQRRKIMSAAAAVLLFLHHPAIAQNADSLVSQNSSGTAAVYSIQQCIDSALKNNPTVKTYDFTQRTAQVQYIQQIGNMLPTLFLRQLIGFYGDSAQGLVPGFLEQIMEQFPAQQVLLLPISSRSFLGLCIQCVKQFAAA